MALPAVRAVAAVAAVLVVRVAVVRLEVVLPHVQAAVFAHVVTAVHVAAWQAVMQLAQCSTRALQDAACMHALTASWIAPQSCSCSPCHAACS